MMPVTTDSELALEFYETGMIAYNQLKRSLAWQNFELAVNEDPNFFMAYFWMYFTSSKDAKDFAERALKADAQLNEGEKHIKAAFSYLLDGDDEKVVEHLEAAVELYPSDPNVHKILYILQYFLKDLEGALESVKRAIEVQPEFPLAYNQLGYTLMDLEDFDEAEKAFDRYIKLAPRIANPYDSKGDFYMATEQYEKAYESYMKAYEIDSSFAMSERKAIKAKQLLQRSGEPV